MLQAKLSRVASRAAYYPTMHMQPTRFTEQRARTPAPCPAHAPPAHPWSCAIHRAHPHYGHRHAAALPVAVRYATVVYATAVRLMICIPTYGGGRCHAHGSRRMHAASRVREHSSSGGRCIVRGHMERIPKLEQFTQPRSCKRPTARCRAARRLPPAKCHQADLHQAARRAPHRASVRSSPRRGSA